MRGVLEAEWQAASAARPGLRHLLLPYILGAAGLVAVATATTSLVPRFLTGSFERAVWYGTPSNHTLVGEDASGRELWRLAEIDGARVAAPDRLLSRDWRPAVLRTDDGQAIIAVCTRENPTHDMIHGVDAQSGEVLWSRYPKAELPERQDQGMWACAWQEVFERGSAGESLFVIGWREHSYAPSALEFCRPDGSVLETYYHPGHIYLHCQVDSDQDGCPELLFYGYNNSSLSTLDGIRSECVDLDHYPVVLIVLDGPTSGQAYPGLRWSNIPRAAERTYLIIPPFDPANPINLLALSCSEDMRVLAQLADHRKLHLAPGLRPTHFSMPRWTPEWEEIRDRVDRCPVYSIVAGEPIRMDLPINSLSEEDCDQGS